MARRGAGYRIETLSGRTFGHARYIHTARRVKKRCEREYARCVVRDLEAGGVLRLDGYSKKRRRTRRWIEEG